MTDRASVRDGGAYLTVEGGGEGFYEEKKSRFLAEVRHVESEDEALDFIAEVKNRYPDARHHVYAYVLRSGNRVRYTDDGEPKRTAGLPVLDVIEHVGVRDVACVVTRYFGGTLLGTGGLVRAYTKSAQDAFAHARIVELDLCDDILLSVDYPLYDQVARYLSSSEAEVVDVDFGSDVSLQIRCRATQTEALKAALAELTCGHSEFAVESAQLQMVSAHKPAQ